MISKNAIFICRGKDTTVSHMLIFVFSTGQVSYLKVLGMYVSVL